MPRSTSFTESVGGIIARSIEAGLSDRAACGVADVPLRTFRRWVATGRKVNAADPESRDPLAVFARKVDAARAMAATNVITSASKTDWKAAAWQLEKLCPEVYGRPGLDELERRVNALARKMGVDLNAVGV